MERTIKIICNNKKAFHNYFISDTYEAGIELLGSEVKSVRLGGVNINDSFVSIKNNEIILKNAYIKSYEKTTSFIPDAFKNRKLLMHKREINKLQKQIEQKGLSIVPLKLYFKYGRVKVEIGVAKGKKLYDKRDVLKEKTEKRKLDREIKSF